MRERKRERGESLQGGLTSRVVLAVHPVVQEAALPVAEGLLGKLYRGLTSVAVVEMPCDFGVFDARGVLVEGAARPQPRAQQHADGEVDGLVGLQGVRLRVPVQGMLGYDVLPRLSLAGSAEEEDAFHRVLHLACA